MSDKKVDKKTSTENTNVPTQALNPAARVEVIEIRSKVEYSQYDAKEERHNDKK